MDFVKRFKIEIAVTTGILGTIFLDTSLAFGRAIGIANFAVILATLVFAVFFCSTIMSRFSFVKSRPVFTAALFITSAAFHTVLMMAIDDAFDLGKSFATEKIVYYCETRFEQRKCAMEVNLCPSCVDGIGGIRREKMANRLKGYRVYYSRIPKNRSVASTTEKIKPH